MDIFKIAALILLVVILISSLPTFNKQIQSLIAIACSILVLLYTTNEIIPAIEEIKLLLGQVSFDGIDIILKAIGIGLITQFISDICLDNNNKALSNQMIFLGRVAIILTALPIFMQVLDVIRMLIT